MRKEKTATAKQTAKTGEAVLVAKSIEHHAAEKTLGEMNLLDDFLFNAVVSYPDIGERFVRSLLKIIFGREFKQLPVTAQKVFYGVAPSRHGARLDVYIETENDTEGRAAVYDIEPDQINKSADIRSLPRRVRFYHGRIAARSFNSGADYEDLKNVIIIMITPYDPFGYNRMMYTIKNKCAELPDMEYEDGAGTLFLYTKGTVGIPSKAVEQLLHYMEDTSLENAVNEELCEIHRMVETVRKDPEVSRMHVQILEENYELWQKNEQLTNDNRKKDEEIKKLREELNKRNTVENCKK